jgi:hypothetical protein
MRKNIPQDLKFRYKAHIWKKIDKFIKMETHNKVLLLALMGYKENKRYSLNTPDPSPEGIQDKVQYGDSTEVSVRTMYNRNGLAYDAVFGLMGLLTSKVKDPKERLDEVFLVTTETKLSFLELPSVKATFEYMLGGLEVMETVLFDSGNSNSNVCDSIQFYLEESIDDLDVLIG